ncbi:carboxymuconolactone decarboxylase family protein [Amycolatopsis sp. NPDC051903]|uniref:carboxymuconolactone decarboxylase family protein n=1 Tax=Amycolatopsis sp. NPDC051903 TaxID=3363936 RepID=UPI00379ABAE4
MSQRMLMEKVAPQAYANIFELHTYAANHVARPVLDLMVLRASMVNGCAFCVDLHSKDALKAGESAQRLFALAAWRESPFFSREERAALALTDAVTSIGEDGVPGDVWEEARAIWSEKEVADLVMAAVMINAFNRIAISTRKAPSLDA